MLNVLKILCGVSWKVEGVENIPNTPCILVSNHQGQWESFFLQTLIIPSSSIIKKDLLFIPFFGWALACLKPIHLRRRRKYASMKKVIKDGSKKLKKGTSLIIFPEGTGDRQRRDLGLRPVVPWIFSFSVFGFCFALCVLVRSFVCGACALLAGGVPSFKSQEKRGLKRNKGVSGYSRPHTRSKATRAYTPVFCVNLHVNRGPRVVLGAAICCSGTVRDPSQDWVWVCWVRWVVVV